MKLSKFEISKVAKRQGLENLSLWQKRKTTEKNKFKKVEFRVLMICPKDN